MTARSFLSCAQFSIVQRSVTAPTIKDAFSASLRHASLETLLLHAFAGSGNGLCGGS